MTISIRLNKGGAADVASGRPWVFRSAIDWTSEGELLTPGSIVTVTDGRGVYLATAALNPKPELCARVLTKNAREAIDETFFQSRFSKALERRAGWFKAPYYRLIHSDGDGISGLIVDRYGELLVCQVTALWLWNLREMWIPIMQNMLPEIRGILIDHSGAYAKREGIPEGRMRVGNVPNQIEVIENGCIYLVDMEDGQKTGWFFDQRANRAHMTQYVSGKSVIDLYSHSGGFGLLAAKHGAESVLCVDRSKLALSLAQKAAERNAVSNICRFHQAEIYEDAEQRIGRGEIYDVVMVDPPAFIKQKTHKAQGLKGYEKLVRLTAPLTSKDGIYCITSCSHHASPREFHQAIERAFREVGVSCELLHQAGADKDHPVHPQLPETSYLKFLVYRRIR